MKITRKRRRRLPFWKPSPVLPDRVLPHPRTVQTRPALHSKAAIAVGSPASMTTRCADTSTKSHSTITTGNAAAVARRHLIHLRVAHGRCLYDWSRSLGLLDL